MLGWLPSIVVMSGIFYLSSRTPSELGGIFPFLSSFNWGHFVAYYVLALTYLWPFLKRYTMKISMVSAILLSVLYGMSDEWHQSFVPGRTPDFADIRNDLIGASLAMITYYWWIKRKES